MFKKPANWKTSAVGILQGLTAIVGAVQIMDGISPETAATLATIYGILSMLKGFLGKDADKGSNAPNSVIDSKLGIANIDKE
jgi:hypothetical protein